MLGDISSRRDSCSESFFFNLSMTLLPLLALWRVGERGRQRTLVILQRLSPCPLKDILRSTVPSLCEKPNGPRQEKCCQQDPWGSQLLRKMLPAVSLHSDLALFPNSSCPRQSCRGAWPLSQPYPVLCLPQAAAAAACHWAAIGLPGPPKASLNKETIRNFSRICTELCCQNSLPFTTHWSIFNRGQLKPRFFLDKTQVPNPAMYIVWHWCTEARILDTYTLWVRGLHVVLLLIPYLFQEALSQSQPGQRDRSMFFQSTRNCLLTVQAMLFISCFTHQQAFSFQTLISLSGSRKVWSLTPLRKHVLQAKRSLGQRHHICVRPSSQHNWCCPYICWCLDTGEVRKSFKSITEPAKI